MELYHKHYFNDMMERYKGSAEKVNNSRWNFVKEFGPKITLDYGCGCNFLSKFAPSGVVVDSYDIGILSENEPYPQTGIIHDHYDLIFFNDVLEHVDWKLSPDEGIKKILHKTNYVHISVPILPINKKLENWKHYRPNEHLTCFTEESLDKFMEVNGLCIIKSGYPECPPREDIISAVYKKC